MTHAQTVAPTSSHAKPVLRVLHIAEALGGGLMAALKDYISNSGIDIEHVILAQHRRGHDTGDFAGVPVRELGSLRSPAAVGKTILRSVRETEPDVIHVHSSWAGLICRLLPIDRTKIVYTPHCYAFERQDIGPIFRTVYRIAEGILARRTEVVAAVSPREADLARSLKRGQEVHYVPNIAGINRDNLARRVPAPRRRPTVVTTGRIMAQKDPAWFQKFVQELRRRDPLVKITWLGGGEPEDEAEMRGLGVNVTGWIDRATLIDELAQASVYVHTAAWEGAPLSILEAATLGVPVFARRIESLESLDVPFLFDTPAEMAERVVTELRDGDVFETELRTAEFSARHTASEQRKALTALYARFMRLSGERKNENDVQLIEVLNPIKSLDVLGLRSSDTLQADHGPADASPEVPAS